MIIEIIISLKQINDKLDKLNLPQEPNSISYSCPMLINIEHIATARPYLDIDGIPDFGYIHITMANGKYLFIEYSYKKLQQLLTK